MTADPQGLSEENRTLQPFVFSAMLRKTASPGVDTVRVMGGVQFGACSDEVRGALAAEHLADGWSIEILEIAPMSSECAGRITAWNTRSEGLQPSAKGEAAGDPVLWALQNVDTGNVLSTKTFRVKEAAESAARRQTDNYAAFRAVPLYAHPAEQGKDGWQDIASAPRDGTPIMIGWWHKGQWTERRAWWNARFDSSYDYETKDVVYYGAWTDSAVKSFVYGECQEYNPTLWRPLPAAPALVEGRGE